MRELVRFVQQRLAEEADPVKAPQMAAYMKTDMPFYGVQKPARVAILREARKQFPIETNKAYRDAVAALWALEHREEKYLAITLARGYPQYIRRPNIPLYRRLVVEGAWWDFVDELAVNLIGEVVHSDREAMNPMLDRWIDDRNMWLRRTAIICQLKHKNETDERRLFDYSRQRAHETEFFTRKAIGWALREYAKTNPDAVRRFLTRHCDEFSTLTLREAGKHLDL